MKYIIEIPDAEQKLLTFNDQLFIPVTVGDAGQKTWCNTFFKIKPYSESDRASVENEVWSFVNTIENNITAAQYEDIFGTDNPYEIMSYQEARDMYKRWEAGKEDGDNIKKSIEKFMRRHGWVNVDLDEEMKGNCVVELISDIASDVQELKSFLELIQEEEDEE